MEHGVATMATSWVTSTSTRRRRSFTARRSSCRFSATFSRAIPITSLRRRTCSRPAHIAMGGYQQLVRGDVFRGKFRNSFEKPEPFEPGKVTKIEFELPDIFHTFRRGHRVMVQVQSSWFPLVDRNPQTFVNIPTAKPEDFRKATQRIHRAGAAASALTVLVLPAGGK